LDAGLRLFFESKAPSHGVSLKRAPEFHMNTITKLLVAAAFFSFSGCHLVGIKGNGNITTENRTSVNFSSIEADGAYEIQWTNGATSVAITTDQNLLGHIMTTVESDKLHIRSHEPLRPTHGIKLKISSPALTGAQLNGAVRFGASKLAGQTFYLEANGATRVALDGSVQGLIASLNGASRLDAVPLQTQTTELSISGAGRADVDVSESLKVAISGAGKVVYSGNPKRVEKDISGAGSIKPRE